MVASRHIIKEKGLMLRRSKTSRFKFPNMLFGVKIYPSVLTGELAVGEIRLAAQRYYMDVFISDITLSHVVAVTWLFIFFIFFLR